MGNYIHEQPAWPTFTWENDQIVRPLAGVRYKQGHLLGKWEGLGAPLPAMDAKGVLTQDATRDYDQPLTRERLLMWHRTLFPAGMSGESDIRIGLWRDDAGGVMQLISTVMEQEYIHYEAPAAARIDSEITTFLQWFNSDTGIDAIIKAAVAHLWFATLYPFDDGNGRIAAAITDRQLAHADQSPLRLYHVAAEINADQHAYYQILEQTQKGNLDITAWLLWFLQRVDQAITQAENNLSNVTHKTDHFEAHGAIALSERQRKILSKLTTELEGRLTSTKWAELAQCSPDTALRDIHDLMNKGILEKEEGGGRSTRYRMKV